MATATDSTTASVILFPSDRVRAPDLFQRAMDEWARARAALDAAEAFRGMTERDATSTVRAMMFGGGALAVAELMEGTGRAIHAVQSIARELAAIDRKIAEAADRVLAEMNA